MLAVGVAVYPYPVADAGQLHQSGVPAQVVFSGGQGGGDRQPGTCVGVAVAGITAHVLGRKGVARWFDELNLVVAGHQVGKQVVARVACVGGRDCAGQ